MCLTSGTLRMMYSPSLNSAEPSHELVNTPVAKMKSMDVTKPRPNT